MTLPATVMARAMRMGTEIEMGINGALARVGVGDFAAGAVELLGELGYRSGRVLPGQSGDAGDLLRRLPAAVEGTLSERDFIAEAESVRILFQVTDAEIGAAGEQQAVFRSDGPDGGGGIDAGSARSFLFAAVELRGGAYPRSRYAAFTREINKRFQHPTVVLFRTRADGTGGAGTGAAGTEAAGTGGDGTGGDETGADETGGGRVTLAFVHRRPNRNDPTRDALGNVSLVREIDGDNPHRAHLDILADLALPARLEWMDGHGEPRNFDGLLAAWLAALDTEELNRRFYRELFEWFERALDLARFPTDEAVILEPEEHIIRLITRLLFVWFLKEKGLVAGDLFIEHQAGRLLKDYDRNDGDSYYRAILQNLFFATLNTEVDQRRFSTQTRNDHRETSRYRYRDEIADPERLLTQFARTPFVNGGLFDCLDSFEGSGRGGYRVDCFTDNARQRAGYSIPNRLFFGDDGSPGLIDLFERYKFTVEENTPAEQEVALDPELLGKVFENLLAAVNPETSLTARKETGSYYTPRPVVEYMVDEALAGVLSERGGAVDADTAGIERIRRLLDYGDAFADADALFDAGERERMVRAIAGLKALDPAVGSGAFPMGILHKLTLALRRLDPDNALWEGIQREQAAARAAAAFGTDDQADRDAELNAISDIFERYRDSDYGRKLYLIQNCIYGVDIQPIAVQIAKLRFFIALAIEQEPNDDKTDNYGIRPLPNLETRFVAADTLLPLERPAQMPLGQTDAVIGLEREIAANRERHFHAVKRQDKLDCRRRDDELRGELAQELQGAGFPAASAGQIAAWDPFDQNGGAADWFDAGYMFGAHSGFDVVIGNPPYINVENLPEDKRRYLFANYETCVMRTDIYIAFLERSLSIINDQGLMCFIIPAAFTVQKYAAKMRQKLIDGHHIRELVDASDYRIFENAVVYNVILSAAKSMSETPTRIRRHSSNADFDNRSGTEFTVNQNYFATLKDSRFDTNPPDDAAIAIKDKVWHNAVRLDQICLVAYGARLNHRTQGKRFGKTHYISPTQIVGGKRFCEGENIDRYTFSQNGWLNYQPGEHYNPMFPELFENEKLMFINIVKDKLRFAYDNQGFYNSHTVVNCVRLDLLAKATHTTAVRAVRNADLALAQQFDYKYLLAVLNSQFINWYFRNFLSENLHFYPNDAKQLPIPKATSAQQRRIVRLVERILGAQGLGAGADVREWEMELDGLVNGLYGLTGEEAGVVGG